MSFLEFVCRRLLGPPPWRCPYHDDKHPSFSVRPPKAGYKVKYKCFACGAWGDEMDLLKLFHPRDSYSDRLERVAALRREYDAQPFSVTGDLRGVPPQPTDDPEVVDAALLELLSLESEPFIHADERLIVPRVLAYACDIADRHGIELTSLASAAARYVIERKEMDRVME